MHEEKNMSMHTRVKGVRDLDAKFADMLAVKYACEKVNIPYPYEVKQYFGEPELSEIPLRQKMAEMEISDAVTKYSLDGIDGWQVDITQLPHEVKAIRFENSY